MENTLEFQRSMKTNCNNHCVGKENHNFLSIFKSSNRPSSFDISIHIQSDKISNQANNRYNKKAPARPIEYPQIGQASAYRAVCLPRKHFMRSRSNAAQLYLRQHGTQRVCRLVQKFRCRRSVTLPDQVPAICK